MSFKSIESFGKKILKTGLAIGLATSAETPVQAENFKSTDQKKEKTENAIELTATNPSPESYDASEKIKHIPRKEQYDQARKENPLNALLDDMQYSENVTLLKEEQAILNNYDEKLADLLRMEFELNKLEKSSSEYTELLAEYENKKKDLERIDETTDNLQLRRLEIQKDKHNVLSDSQLKHIYERAPQIIKQLEDIRENLISIVNSSQYLKKLQTEFNCDLKEAKEHQTVRLNNLKTVTIFFRNSSELSNPYGGGVSSSAYYTSERHEVCLPYDKPEEELLHFATHELIHSITNGENGLSAKTKSLLQSNFKKSEKHSSEFNIYLSKTTERYVRLKMLEIELDRLGIKKVGKKISSQGYKKMMDWYEEQKIKTDNSSLRDNFQLLETTDGLDEDSGREKLNQLFQELADNQEDNSSENKSDYRHSGWDYNNPDNLA
jgi:hypothetical protein